MKAKKEESVWMNKRNGWIVLAGVLFCAAIGKFIESLPLIEARFRPKKETSLKTKIIDRETKTAELFAEQVVRMKITAYCPCKKCCGQYAGRKTIFGKDPWETSGIAANLKLLPEGTILEIPGIGTRIVDSYGGKKVNDQEKKEGINYVVNLRMKDHNEAKKFGVKILPIRILERIKPTLPSEISLGRTALVKVTGYCPCKDCCGSQACGLTSTLKDAWKTKGVAADPSILPYGTKLEIPGIGIQVVDDTGNDMKKATKEGFCWIDVRFSNHKEAVEFGRQWLEVKILSPN